MKHIVDLAAIHRLPAMYNAREFVEIGGLIAYGANLADLSRRTASFADKILKGAKPSDLPVERSTKFELPINHKTADARPRRAADAIGAGRRGDRVRALYGIAPNDGFWPEQTSPARMSPLRFQRSKADIPVSAKTCPSALRPLQRFPANAAVLESGRMIEGRLWPQW
jgi:hypothetical protein